MRWLDGTANSKDMNLANSGRQWSIRKPVVLPPMGSKRVRHDLATEQQFHTLSLICLDMDLFSVYSTWKCFTFLLYRCVLSLNLESFKQLFLQMFFCPFVSPVFITLSINIWMCLMFSEKLSFYLFVFLSLVFRLYNIAQSVFKFANSFFCQLKTMSENF